MNLSGISSSHSHESLRLTQAFESLVLPQTQAGLVANGSSRLSASPNGVSNQMEPMHIDRSLSPEGSEQQADRLFGDVHAHFAAHSKIGLGVRAVNRLLWSLWLLLLPLIWPSTDWIGLLILAQASFVAAKLIQPVETSSAASARLQ